MAEATNYCTANWCTTEEASLFTYAEGEHHGTYDFCDDAYEEPVLPQEIPGAVLEVTRSTRELDGRLARVSVTDAGSC